MGFKFWKKRVKIDEKVISHLKYCLFYFDVIFPLCRLDWVNVNEKLVFKVAMKLFAISGVKLYFDLGRFASLEKAKRRFYSVPIWRRRLNL